MSCREIDGKKYILSDISYECYTKIHVDYITYICVPGLLIWVLILPAYILRKLMLNKNRLDWAIIRL
jgi:hypothetical protein